MISTGDKEDVNKAVEAAKAALVKWRKEDASARGRLLNKLADLILAHADELAEYVSFSYPSSSSSRHLLLFSFSPIFSNLLFQHTYSFSLYRLESLDNGKPVLEARHVDINFAVKVFQYYAGKSLLFVSLFLCLCFSQFSSTSTYLLDHTDPFPLGWADKIQGKTISVDGPVCLLSPLISSSFFYILTIQHKLICF